ncbi:MAG: (Fe-S)-binding protein [Thermoprotei archaeon]|nr:(Fe-S)-binding protein [Thermoprotei archaeon]
MDKSLRVWVESEAGRCVYCGFCEPVCPTLYPGGHRGYGPRGRVNIALNLVEGGKPTEEVLKSIYSCLLCGACNLVCPAKIDIVSVIRVFRALMWRTKTY